MNIREEPVVNVNPETLNKITAIVNAQYLDDIEDSVRCRGCCKDVGIGTAIVGIVMVAVATVITYAAGVWGYKFLAFIAGSINVVGSIVIGMSSYAMYQSREYNEVANKVLAKLKLGELVDVTIDATGKGQKGLAMGPDNNEEVDDTNGKKEI